MGLKEHTGAAGVFLGALLISRATRRLEVVGGSESSCQGGKEENRSQAQHGGGVYKINSDQESCTERTGSGEDRKRIRISSKEDGGLGIAGNNIITVGLDQSLCLRSTQGNLELEPGKAGSGRHPRSESNNDNMQGLRPSDR